MDLNKIRNIMPSRAAAFMSVADAFEWLLPKKIPMSRNQSGPIVKGTTEDSVIYNSWRWAVFKRTFLEHGGIVKCACCGIEATHSIVIHRDHNVFLDLIGIHPQQGTGVVRFTVDHILPRALGGNHRIENLRTMCAACNAKRGDSLNAEDVEYIMANLDKLILSERYRQQKWYGRPNGFKNAIERLNSAAQKHLGLDFVPIVM